MKKNYKAIIFDLGGVLIDWNPEHLYTRYFNDKDRMDFFLQNICTSDWNEEQDAGRLLTEATESLVKQYPDWEQPIRDYYGRWTEMLRGPIPETVEILRKLREVEGLKLYALTNWSGELFPYALGKYDFLHWFDGRVVSGDEKMRKPNPAFYQLLLDRYDLKPEEVLFIDDNLRNVKAAREMGIETIHFVSAEELGVELGRRGF